MARIGQLRLGGSLVGLAALMSGISYSFPVPARSAEDKAPAASGSAETCAALEGRQVGSAVIDKAEFLAVGTATSPYGQKAATEICKVSARVSAGPDSEIKIRVWLPANWNGKMYGVGGGGFSGSLVIDGIALTDPVNKGYASVATDAGHDHSDKVIWALNHPEKIADFGHRANHLGAVAAKAILNQYYGAPAKRSYFHGCSNGGRDALMLAQRYPGDYDGIIVGAPANRWTALMSSFRRNEQVVRLSPGVDTLGPKLGLVHDAVMKQCDALDGARDGLIGNPNQCRFNPAVLQCKSNATSTASCLSKPEVAAFRGIYQGTRTRDGKLIMAGYSPGSEYQWSSWFTKPDGPAPGMGRDFFRFMVYNDPKWDENSFVLGRDYPRAKRDTGPLVDATDTDLRPFLRTGGKLLMYHGWDDAAIPARNSIDYFGAARRTAGSRAEQMRLFMVPGMAHCGGGNGPGSLDTLGALETWVENGTAPEQLVATQYENEIQAKLGQPTKVLKTHPACPWPKTPHYRSGPVGDASSFVCR